MRIAIFTDTFAPRTNGVAQVAYKSALALSDLGHEVKVFTVSDKNGNDVVNITANGKFEVVNLPSFPSPSSLGYAGERVTLPLGLALKKISRFRPHIIHTHTPFGVGWEAVIAGKLFRIPIVGTHHTFYDHYLKHIKMDFKWFKKPSWKIVVAYYNRCALAISPSQSLARELKKQGLKKPIAIVANPINTELFSPVKNQKEKNALKKHFGIKDQSLVYMGRVSYEKSIDKLIFATSLVAKKNPNIVLMVVGDGPEKERLEQLADNLNLKKNVIFTGFKHGKELVQSLQANDIFLTASKSENMPLSVLEGMSTGLPVIGVNALGIPEIVHDNINGFIVKPDDIQEMADKIIGLLKNKRKVEKFSLASRKFALKYSQEKIALALQRVYEKVVK